MHESWQLKKSLSNKVSNKFINETYDFALKNGAASGKILGAGGGGFILFISNNQKEKNKLVSALKKKLTNINFGIDDSGSQIVFEK